MSKNDEKKTTMAAPEEFQLEEAELWRVRYLQEKIARLSTELSVARHEQQSFMTVLNNKYSEHGKYTMSSQVDEQGRGKRVLAPKTN